MRGKFCISPREETWHLILLEKSMNRKHQNQDELGPDSAGQSGDIEELSNRADADSESVEELVEEGNAFEAGIVDGVENAPEPDVAEVRTRQVPEDDVPEEYLDEDRAS
jgi:hypothetical protein